MKLTARPERSRGANNLQLTTYSALAGVLLALAFPKFSLGWIAWVALVPFFLALAKAKDWQQATACGFIFGLAFFGVDLFWVMSLSRFVGWWAALAWLCLVLFQALFIVVFSVLFFLLADSKGPGARFSVLGGALLWVLIEYLRGLGPFSVPVGVVGYSQASNLWLIQIAAFTQVYGVSFIVVLVNLIITDMIVKPATKRRGFLIISSLLILVIGFGFYELRGNREVHSQVSEQLLKLALVQPNIDQMVKMNPGLVAPVYSVHEEMTRQAAKTGPQIIIWPETAIFAYLLHNPKYLDQVKTLARETGAWLIIGTPDYELNRIYNAMVSFSPSGEVVSQYNKQLLVPFGEYLPFRRLLYPLLRATGYYEQNFDSGAGDQPVLAAGKKIAPAICFESTLPGLIKKRVNKETDFILTITNDAWFSDSSAPYFHLDNGVFRAIENRKYFVQVGNSGFSAIIDPYGRIVKKTKLNQREVLLSN